MEKQETTTSPRITKADRNWRRVWHSMFGHSFAWRRIASDGRRGSPVAVLWFTCVCGNEGSAPLASAKEA